MGEDTFCEAGCVAFLVVVVGFLVVVVAGALVVVVGPEKRTVVDSCLLVLLLMASLADSVVEDEASVVLVNASAVELSVVFCTVNVAGCVVVGCSTGFLLFL